MDLSSFARSILPLALVLAAGCGGAPDETQGTSQSDALTSGIVRRWPPYTGPTWSTTDLLSGAQLPSGIAYPNGNAVSWQVGNYYSDNLQIYGLLCTPTSRPAPYPVAILNHGLPQWSWDTYQNKWVIPAIVDQGWGGCVTMAGNGWLTAVTTYRGETVGPFAAAGNNHSATSQGGIELCGNEVDDVLNLITAVDALPIANPQQVFMWGHSHGSCITELALERGAPVQVAVSLDGPTDFATWINTPSTIQGNPALENPRSSSYAVNDPAALASSDLKFLRIHAEGDQTVQVAQTCELANVLPGSSNYYLYSGITPPGTYYGAPEECAPWPGISWKYGQLLPEETGGTWASPTVLVYSGLDHAAILKSSWPEWASFVNQVATSRGWPASVPPSYVVFEN